MLTAVVAITGGSGSGKSTLVNNLCANYAEVYRPFRLEDYYLPFEDIKVRYKDRANLDVVEAFDIKQLLADLHAMRYSKEDKRIILFEGFLANKVLCDANLPRCLSVYLEAPHTLRFSRRQGQMMDTDYEQNVLIPMHKLYVEPQMTQSDIVIDVANKSISQVERLAHDSILSLVEAAA